jgi:hypothetical protein
MNKGQQTGMRGVYLTAARLSEEGLVVSPTSRSARGADLLVTDPECRKAFSVQVKTNARTFGFFLVGKHAASIRSDSHIFVLVNLRPKGTEFFVIPSVKLSALVKTYKAKTNSQWWFIKREDAEPYRDGWNCFDTLKDAT